MPIFDDKYANNGIHALLISVISNDWTILSDSTIFISILTRDTDIAILSVHPSVRDVPVSDENGLTYRHSFFSPYGSPITLVLSASNIFTKFRRGHPYGSAKYRWSIKFRDFLSISRYISQTMQDIAIVTIFIEYATNAAQ